ncbi:hypothetical protein QVD17_09118 [Tagetes erecta]|uniref:Uncharacterized protein n=1 Tax=Tagetes erecta TaxID=13708 RepID=A0AAD8KYR0_TARER|nr:hypothetical protein QVD17_09118 [Tagetes erecta]
MFERANSYLWNEHIYIIRTFFSGCGSVVSVIRILTPFIRIMSYKRLSEIEEGQEAEPIEIRVIKNGSHITKKRKGLQTQDTYSLMSIGMQLRHYRGN